jgi:hypothetical protein
MATDDAITRLIAVCDELMWQLEAEKKSVAAIRELAGANLLGEDQVKRLLRHGIGQRIKRILEDVALDT